MKKFEVCIRGTNFLIKTNGKTKKKAFYAARFVEATDVSTAVEKVVDLLKGEIKDTVANKKSDPPDVKVVDVSEVYYFQDKMVVESMDNMVLPCHGFLWENTEVVEEDLGKSISSMKGNWQTLWRSIMEKDFHLHTMLIHFTSALYPVAILFMFLFLLSGRGSFHKAYFYTMVLATLSVPFSYLTGILQWRRQFKGIMIPIFFDKIKYGLLAFVIGAVCTIWFYFNPEILEEWSVFTWVFILLNLSILPPLVYLGHLGGIIVYEGPE